MFGPGDVGKPYEFMTTKLLSEKSHMLFKRVHLFLKRLKLGECIRVHIQRMADFQNGKAQGCCCFFNGLTPVFIDHSSVTG